MGGVVFSMSRGSKMGVRVGLDVHFQNFLNLKEAELEKMKSDARHRHETVNRWLTGFGVLDEKGFVMTSVCIPSASGLLQLLYTAQAQNIETNAPLYEVNYVNNEELMWAWVPSDC